MVITMRRPRQYGIPVVVAAAALLLMGTEVRAGSLWALGYYPGAGGEAAFKIDPDTGAVTYIVLLETSAWLTDIEVLDGQLYTIGRQDTPSHDHMTRFDPLTGAATELADPGGIALRGLAVDPSTKTFYSVNTSYYGAVNSLDAGGNLLGEAVEYVTGGLTQNFDLTFDPSTGYLFATDDGQSTDIISIDPSTGHRFNPLDTGHYLEALALDTDTHQLYGVTYSGSPDLYRVDPTTGTASYVATLPDGTYVSGLAYESTIPEPGSLGLLCLGVLGLAIRTRRRSSTVADDQ